jgi:hypothetical protein
VSRFVKKGLVVVGLGAVALYSPRRVVAETYDCGYVSICVQNGGVCDLGLMSACNPCPALCVMGSYAGCEGPAAVYYSCGYEE